MKKRNILIGACVLVAAAGLWIALRPSEKSGITLETAPTERITIRNSVTATGTVEPVTEVELGTAVSGIIDKLYADYNDVVKAGQLIAEMDQGDFAGRAGVVAGRAGELQDRVRIPAEDLRPHEDAPRKGAGDATPSTTRRTISMKRPATPTSRPRRTSSRSAATWGMRPSRRRSTVW